MRVDKELTTAKEDSLDCTEIYPSRVGTVSVVFEVNKENNFYDFVDEDIPKELNFEDCLIAGENMTVIFQTGMLTGKEFEVKYIHEEKDKKAGRRFEIVPQEIDGITMPDLKLVIHTQCSEFSYRMLISATIQRRPVPAGKYSKKLPNTCTSMKIGSSHLPARSMEFGLKNAGCRLVVKLN